MKSRIGEWLFRGEPRGRLQRGRFVALLLVAVLAACSDGTGPSSLVSITPASQTVTLQQTPNGAFLRTSVTLTNISSNPVVYDPCALSLERKADPYVALSGDGPTYPWATVWSSFCAALSAEAIARIPQSVAPHSSVTVPVNAPVSVTLGQSQYFDGSPGTYRVRLVLQTDIIGTARLIPHDLSVSDPFTLVR
jgi:hypothetical protein